MWLLSWMEMGVGQNVKCLELKAIMKVCKQSKLREASDIGIKYLTLYAFSTENWSRPESEVNYIMNLPVNFLKTFLPELIEKNEN